VSTTIEVSSDETDGSRHEVAAAQVDFEAAAAVPDSGEESSEENAIDAEASIGASLLIQASPDLPVEMPPLLTNAAPTSELVSGTSQHVGGLLVAQDPAQPLVSASEPVLGGTLRALETAISGLPGLVVSASEGVGELTSGEPLLPDSSASPADEASRPILTASGASTESAAGEPAFASDALSGLPAAGLHGEPLFLDMASSTAPGDAANHSEPGSGEGREPIFPNSGLDPPIAVAAAGPWPSNFVLPGLLLAIAILLASVVVFRGLLPAVAPQLETPADPEGPASAAPPESEASSYGGEEEPVAKDNSTGHGADGGSS
jgi:hypothetical protein